MAEIRLNLEVISDVDLRKLSILGHKSGATLLLLLDVHTDIQTMLTIGTHHVLAGDAPLPSGYQVDVMNYWDLHLHRYLIGNGQVQSGASHGQLVALLLHCNLYHLSHGFVWPIHLHIDNVKHIRHICAETLTNALSRLGCSNVPIGLTLTLKGEVTQRLPPNEGTFRE